MIFYFQINHNLGFAFHSSNASEGLTQDAAVSLESTKRPMKGHSRNKSNGSSGGGLSGRFHAGAFKPGHNRSESVLSRISRLSVHTLG